MATIALRVPTIVPGQAVLPHGQCYILFPRGPLAARDLIAEKVRAELRKARAGGMAITSLRLLLPDDVQIGFGPLDQQLAIARACRAFNDGLFLLLYNGRPLVALEEMVELAPNTSLLFVHVPVHAAVHQERRLEDAA